MGNRTKPLYLPKFWWSILHVLLYFGIEMGLMLPLVFFVAVLSLTNPASGVSMDETIMRFLSSSLANGAVTLVITALFLLILKSRYSLEPKTLFSRRYLSAGVIVFTIVTTIGAAILTSEVDNFMRVLIPNWDQMGAGIAEMFDNSPLWQNFLGAVIIAPLNEEFIVRGLWLRGYTKHYKPWVGIIISSVLFGVMHMNLPQFVGATLSGLFLGWAYTKTNSILMPILIHATFNSVSLFGGYLPPVEGFSTDSASGYQPLWFNALGLVLFLGGIFVLNRLLNAERKKIIQPRPIERAEEVY
jgi:hypothetical protein